MRSAQIAQSRLGFRVLSDCQLDDIHDASMEILARTGVRVCNEEAIGLLRRAGAFVEDGNLVKVPARLVDWAVRCAPHSITVFNRRSEAAMHLGRRRTYFGTGSDTLNVIDPVSGERRPAVLADVADFARVCDALPHVDFVMSMGVASDLDQAVAELHHFYAMVSNTVKPVVYTATTIQAARRVVEMAEVIAGGRDAFRQRPFGVLYIEPISPLSFAPEPMAKLLFAAERGIPCVFMSGMMGGATGPVTLAGSLALANAESLAGVLIAQLKCEGAPVISGGGVLTTDMATGGPGYGAPEFMLSAAAIAEVARHYGLPSWGYAGCSDAKVFDEQAAADAAHWVLMSALAGANLVHDLGYLESGLTSSFDMLVFCDEMIGKTEHILRGIHIDEETLALDAVDRVGPGGQFLSDDHTVKHFRSNWFPTLEDRASHADWMQSGRRPMRDRVNEKARQILAGHRPPCLDPGVKSALQRLCR
jgi:trimethylamine--corrinoid protein Co-methyltransferase